MSNAGRAPRSVMSLKKGPVMIPDCHWQFITHSGPATEAGSWKHTVAKLQNQEEIRKRLEPLDMEIGEPFTLPPEFVLPSIAMQAGGRIRARADKARPSFRSRTRWGYESASAVYRLLPEALRAQVAEKARDHSLSNGGAECTVGRLVKAYPRKGATIPKPITREEAERAWIGEVGEGLWDPLAVAVLRAKGALEPRVLLGEGDNVVRQNLQSGNSFPVLGQGNDETAAALVVALATMVWDEITAAHSADPEMGVEKWLRKAEKERPWLVTGMGKGKADYYVGLKVQTLAMRFYNSFGRQINMVLQCATQVIEEASESVLDGGACRSMAGVALNRGGAAALVMSLEEQLRQQGAGHARMGDDSMVVFLWGDYLLLFALDCSSFDLTQHRDLTRYVHFFLRVLVALVSAPAAALLHALMRQRQVVVALNMVRTFFHGGPSGLPLQSKVNGVTMGVLIERTLEFLAAMAAAAGKFGEPPSEVELDAILQTIGADMGLVVRLEQYSAVYLSSMQAELRPVHFALAHRPFLFLGYYFYYESGILNVEADYPRALSQLRYPSITWRDTKTELEGMEIGRVMATLLAFGRPRNKHRAAVQAAVDLALGWADAFVAQHGDLDSIRLRWSLIVSAQQGDDDEGGDVGVAMSLAGLSAALRRGFDANWNGGLAGTSATDFTPLERERLRLPKEKLPVFTPSMARRIPASRRATAKTDGRNPNTKVFAPALPPRERSARIHENADWHPGARDQRAAAEAAAWLEAWERQQAEYREAAERQGQGDDEPDEPADYLSEDAFGDSADEEEYDRYRRSLLVGPVAL